MSTEGKRIIDLVVAYAVRGNSFNPQQWLDSSLPPSAELSLLLDASARPASRLRQLLGENTSPDAREQLLSGMVEQNEQGKFRPMVGGLLPVLVERMVSASSEPERRLANKIVSDNVDTLSGELIQRLAGHVASAPSCDESLTALENLAIVRPAAGVRALCEAHEMVSTGHGIGGTRLGQIEAILDRIILAEERRMLASIMADERSHERPATMPLPPPPVIENPPGKPTQPGSPLDNILGRRPPQ